MAEVDKSEKITINIGLVDLGQIDLLVDEGFFANRTDFIRTAIRRQLDSREAVVHNTVQRRRSCWAHSTSAAENSSSWRRQASRSSCAFSGWPRSPTTSARSWRWRRSRRSRYSEPSGTEGGQGRARCPDDLTTGRPSPTTSHGSVRRSSRGSHPRKGHFHGRQPFHRHARSTPTRPRRATGRGDQAPATRAHRRTAHLERPPGPAPPPVRPNIGYAEWPGGYKYRAVSDYYRDMRTIPAFSGSVRGFAWPRL